VLSSREETACKPLLSLITACDSMEVKLNATIYMPVATQNYEQDLTNLPFFAEQ